MMPVVAMKLYWWSAWTQQVMPWKTLAGIKNK